jgi:hypothetical protein
MLESVAGTLEYHPLLSMIITFYLCAGMKERTHLLAMASEDKCFEYMC